jgi:biopolymer transport protein ExbD
MNLRRKHRDEAEVSTESLNDIMFFLLLFFLIISTLANPNVIKLNLPKSANNVNAIKIPVTLSVKKDKTYFIGQTQIPFEQLEEALLDAVSGLDQPTVVLNVDRELSVQDLVDVMQIGVKAKVKMVLGTDKATST